MTTIETTPETVTQSRYAKYYHEVVKPDEQRLKQERERIRTTRPAATLASGEGDPG